MIERKTEVDDLKVRRAAFPLMLMLILGVLFLPHLSCASAQPAADGENLGRMTAFAGGKHEASGVAHVPGTDGVLFVDDGRPGEVFWMRLDGSGKQIGAIKAVALGIGVIDPEGITTDGTYFYVVGSQSKPKGVERAGLVRFRFNAERQVAEGVEAISGLKKFLMKNVGELREMGDRKAKDGGLNIEGLAWDPQGSRLLLGLRSPVINGQALIVPLRLRESQGAFSGDNLEVAETKVIRLPLGGSGVRSVEYDGRSKAFKIIAGAAENQEKTDFQLWEWSGEANPPVLREAVRFDRRLKPEGVTRAAAGGREFTFIVFDASGYTVMD